MVTPSSTADLLTPRADSFPSRFGPTIESLIELPAPFDDSAIAEEGILLGSTLVNLLKRHSHALVGRREDRVIFPIASGSSAMGETKWQEQSEANGRDWNFLGYGND